MKKNKIETIYIYIYDDDGTHPRSKLKYIILRRWSGEYNIVQGGNVAHTCLCLHDDFV